MLAITPLPIASSSKSIRISIPYAVSHVSKRLFPQFCPGLSNKSREFERAPVNPKNFLTELKRRNVYRAAIAYEVGAWFLMQLTTQVFPFFEIPNSAVRFVVIALAVGFPIAMLLSWLYEFTPEGIVRTEARWINPAISPIPLPSLPLLNVWD